MERAKVIVAVLIKDREIFGEVQRRLEKKFGKTDFVGKWHPFSHTDYYVPEMGSPLFRRFVSFEKLFDPTKAAKLKRWTQKIEKKFMVGGRRKVNLDAGYIDANKVVLVTGKQGAHKIPVDNGVWIDLLLYYNKGWSPMPWAFPDFKSGEYFSELNVIRKKFKTSQRTK